MTYTDMEAVPSNPHELAAKIEAAAVKAIKSSPYDWRTAEGIAKELGQDLDTVTKTITNSTKFIKNSRSSKTGKSLYGVREDYAANAPIAEKIASVLAAKVL